MSPARRTAGRVLALLLAATTAACGTDAASVSTTAPLAARQPGGKTPPTLTALSPASTLMGSADVRVTLAGTGFAKSSGVTVTRSTGSSFAPAVTFVSSTELRVTLPSAELAAPTTLQVSVVGGSAGASAPLPFTVASPVPVATSVAPASAVQGGAGTTVLVTGAGFHAGSVAHFDGAPRATSVSSATQLSVTLVAADLSVAGAHAITVVNPAPGGGTSAALPFTVVEAPRIVGLPSYGAHAGRPGFSLAVDGVGFTSDAVVQWNGVDRPTTFGGGTRLSAAISADDVAAPGTAAVRVRTPSLGVVTSEVTVTIRALAAPAVTGALAVDLQANDVVYDPRAGLLYASVRSADARFGNQVVAISPSTGAVVDTVFVGSEPEFLAISDDGQYLYVSLRGSFSVRRVSLATFTAGLEFSLGANTVVDEMLVPPGAPRSVVLSKMYLGISPRHAGVFVYDDGTQRGTATPGHTGSNSIAFAGSAASPLYGYNNETTEFGFRTMAVDGAGVRVLATTTGLMSRFYARIAGAGGRIYGSDGAIIDPERRVRTGAFAANTLGMTAAVHADPELGRVYFLTSGALSAFDMNTMQLLGALTVPGTISDHPYAARLRLVRWGADGLAYRADGRVHILRTTLSAR